MQAAAAACPGVTALVCVREAGSALLDASVAFWRARGLPLYRGERWSHSLGAVHPVLTFKHWQPALLRQGEGVQQGLGMEKHTYNQPVLTAGL